MSDDTLSQLVAEAISRNISPVVKWLYATFAGVIVGTAFVVGMVYDVKYSIDTARREAADAQREAREAAEFGKDLRATVVGHDRDIAVIKSHISKSGGE